MLFADRLFEFRVFCWSGKNSFSARWEAAAQFADYLEGVNKARPNAKHVIVTHSHGGTVAAQALELEKFRGDPPIKALICLSTPFAYLSAAGTSDGLLFSGAAASVFSAPILTHLDRTWSVPWLVALLIIVPPLIAALIYSLSLAGPIDSYVPAVIHPAIPIFIVRGSRDEAALTIGFTQAMNALVRLIYKAYDDVPHAWRITSWLGKAFGFLCFTAGGLFAIRLFSSYLAIETLDNFHMIFLIGVWASAVGGLIYIVAYALTAFAVGFFNIRKWACSTVEVEAVPPERQCSIKCYADLDDMKESSLRHGIYDLISVQMDVASVIQSVVDEVMPRLATEDEAREARRRIRQRE